MTLGPRPESAAVMESVPSLPIHSSLLFVLIAGLFLAALVIRARRLPMQPRHTAGLTTAQARAARRRVQRSRRRRHRRTREGREGTMRQNMDQATVSSRAGAHRPPAPSAEFQIHWGRTLLAGLAALGLLAALGTTVAAWLTPLAWSVPALCGVVVLLSLAALQVSAALRRRRKRRARVDLAIQDAMNTHPQVREEAVLRQRSAAEAGAAMGITAGSAPFDALSADSAGHGGPDSLVTLDEDGLAPDAERLFGEGSAESAQLASDGSALFDQGSAEQGGAEQGGAPAAATWTPREVPHPKYLVAEKVERSEPEPLAAPEEPTPSADTKLKQPAAPAAGQSDEAEPAAAEASMDLDAVLKRRRA